MAGVKRILLKKFEIEIPQIPEAFNGFKICHLSDLHSCRFGKLEAAAKELISNIRMDILAFTGDFTSNSNFPEYAFEVLDGAEAPHGKFAVLGNNDYGNKVDHSKLFEMAKDHGIKILVNESLPVNKDSDNIWISGVLDPYLGKDDLNSTLSDVPESGIKILLSHSPGIYKKAVEKGINLVLAGHTHGGQISFPIVGPVWAHDPAGLKYIAGMFAPEDFHNNGCGENKTYMYVTRGIGYSLFALRINCPSEIAVITLRRQR